MKGSIFRRLFDFLKKKYIDLPRRRSMRMATARAFDKMFGGDYSFYDAKQKKIIFYTIHFEYHNAAQLNAYVSNNNSLHFGHMKHITKEYGIKATYCDFRITWVTFNHAKGGHNTYQYFQGQVKRVNQIFLQ